MTDIQNHGGNGVEGLSRMMFFNTSDHLNKNMGSIFN